MKNKLLFILIILASTLVVGQTKTDKDHPSTKGLTCKTCHTCEVPTKQNPCLVPCPRFDMIAIHQTPKDAPAIITIDTLSKMYFPVQFSHKIHAQMSEMAGGCGGCHHYNTSGPIQKCENCHDTNRKRDDLSKPDLQGALHRQCMDCHREWSHSTDCKSCHALKSDYPDKDKKPQLVLNISNHPEFPEPTKIVYETDYAKGKLVTFFHDDHTDKFKLNCTSCHKNESCNRCHDTQKLTVVEKTALGQTIKIKKDKNQHHKPCFSCHQNDACGSCHLNKVMDKFDHAIATGWALNKFHEKLECQKCHGEVKKFTKLKNECASCHTNFVAGKFDHKVTGLQLDETHLEAACSDCHQDKTFAKPVCTNCHEDKSYPKDKPGKMIKL